MSRTEGVDKNLARLNNEMEFYQAGKSKTSKANEAPPQLVQDQRRAANDATSIRTEIEKIEKYRQQYGATL